VHELKYSEAAAMRRIEAMRLISEIPEVADKIESGDLSLSNVCQVQTFFRDVKKAQPEVAMSKSEKLEVIAQLEEKSAREGQKILFAMSPPEALPKERERMVSEEHTQVTFLMNQQLRKKLDQVRALLGPKGVQLSLAELIVEMADLSVERLTEKRFGKRRVEMARRNLEEAKAPISDADEITSDVGNDSGTDEIPRVAGAQTILDGVGINSRIRTRHIPRSVRHAVWLAAGGKCTSCGSHHKLQYDHIKPFALGGDSNPENIQLLCASCNLRRGIQSFGARAMRRT
jgi:hypothetical protein